MNSAENHVDENDYCNDLTPGPKIFMESSETDATDARDNEDLTVQNLTQQVLSSIFQISLAIAANKMTN